MAWPESYSYSKEWCVCVWNLAPFFLIWVCVKLLTTDLACWTVPLVPFVCLAPTAATLLQLFKETQEHVGTLFVGLFRSSFMTSTQLLKIINSSCVNWFCMLHASGFEIILMHWKIYQANWSSSEDSVILIWGRLSWLFLIRKECYDYFPPFQYFSTLIIPHVALILMFLIKYWPSLFPLNFSGRMSRTTST